MEKGEKKSFWSKILGLGKNKQTDDGKKLYSNSRKTRDKIKIALLELLKEEELSKINITDLVKLAGVYRATFYLHYKSLTDVIEDIEKEIYACYDELKTYLEEVDIYNNFSLLVDVIGEAINVDRNRLKIIINANCFSKLFYSLRELLKDILIENFEKYNHKSENMGLNISMFTGGFVFAYRDWVNDDSLDLNVLKSNVLELSKKIFNN